MKGQFDFNKDIKLGESYEYRVLKTIRKKYPQAHKIDGYHKEFDIQIPEKDISVEVKHDALVDKTGNFFIETAYDGEDSGINTTTADWWAITDENTIFWVETDILKYLCRDYPERTFPPRGKDKARTGHLLPAIKLIHSLYVIEQELL